MQVGIVGAGIAGVYLAVLLGEEGVDVLLFDPKAPWEKPCGGGITSRTVSEFPILEGFGSECLSVKKMRMILEDGESSSFSYSGPIRIASRQNLGEYLLRKACARGVQSVCRRVDRVAREGQGWQLHAGGNVYECDFLVGADGVQSLVRRSLPGRFLKQDMTLSVGYWVEADLSEKEVVVGFLSGISGYIWLFPRKNHLSIGIGARVGEASGQGLYASLDGFLEQHFPHVMKHPRTRYAALIPSLASERFSDNRVCGEDWALIGDAAGWVDPLTGEGIYYAFRSAKLLFQALSSGRPQGYATACDREITPELSRASSYVRTFFDPKVTRLLVRLSKENRSVRQLLSRLVSGEQSYLSLKRELLKTLPTLAMDFLRRTSSR